MHTNIIDTSEHVFGRAAATMLNRSRVFIVSQSTTLERQAQPRQSCRLSTNRLLRHAGRTQVRLRRIQHVFLARVHAQEADVGTVRHETVGHELE